MPEPRIHLFSQVLHQPADADRPRADLAGGRQPVPGGLGDVEPVTEEFRLRDQAGPLEAGGQAPVPLALLLWELQTQFPEVREPDVGEGPFVPKHWRGRTWWSMKRPACIIP